jgi:hypothetical protein
MRFLVSVPCVLFVLFGVAHCFLFSEAHYYFWDEFAQWGLVTREVVSTHELYGLASNARRPTAPPAAALWHYFVCTNATYTEGNTYFAQFLLLIAPILPLYEGLSFRRPGWIAVVAALQLFLLANLGHGVTSLFVDHLLSTFFAGILFVHVANPQSRRTLALLALPLFVLTLLKESGVFFAASAALFLVLHHLVHAVGSPAEILRQLRGDRRTAALMCLVLLTPAVAVASWQLRLALLDSDEPPRSAWGIGSRALSRSDDAVSQEALVVRRFVEVFLEQPTSRSEASERFNAFNYTMMPEYRNGGRFSTLGWLVFYVFASGLAFLCARDRERKRAIALLTLYLLAVFAVYGFVMLRVYVTDEGHGALLSSYLRYVNTALLPMVLLSLAWFLPATSFLRPEAQGSWHAPVLTAVLVALFAMETPYFKPLYVARRHHDFRRVTEPWTEQVAARIEAGRSLFVYLPQPGGGLLSWILTYQLTPLPTAVRSGLPEEDPLREALAHDYVWIVETTPELDDKLRSASATTRLLSNFVYRVEDRSGGVALIPLFRPTAAEN